MTEPQPTIAEMRAVCQPAAVLGRRSAEHWTGLLYLRRVSIYVTRFAVKLGVSPNAVTGIMILIGLIGALVLSIGGLGPAIAAAALIQIYVLLDCVDGEVARWTGQSSAGGVYLDRLGHYLVEGSLMVAIGVRAAGGDEPAWIIAGFVAALFVWLEKVETDLVLVARVSAGLGLAPEGSQAMQSSSLAAGRRVGSWFPLHLATHAIEASTLALVAAVFDTWLDSLTATRLLLIALIVISGLMVVLHLVSILNSHRLTASPEDGHSTEADASGST